MWPLLALGGQIGSSLAGGIMGSKGAKEQEAAMAAAIARAQRLRDQGYANAMTSYDKGYDTSRGDLDAGYDAAFDAVGPARQDATNQLYDDLGADGDGLDDYLSLIGDSFETSPGYQWRLDQGQKALAHMMNERGLTRSGAYDKALIEHAQGVASDEYGRHTDGVRDYLNRMEGLAGREGGRNAMIAQMHQGKGAGMADLSWQHYGRKGATQIERAGANAEGAYGQGMNRAEGIANRTNAWTNALSGIGKSFSSYAGGKYGQWG